MTKRNQLEQLDMANSIMKLQAFTAEYPALKEPDREI